MLLALPRDYTKQAAEIAGSLVELNTKLDDQKCHFEQAKAEDQAGPVERKFLTHLQKDIGMVSKCWHGGDYEGNGIFAFLGKRGYGKNSDLSKRGSSRDYTDAIQAAKDIMTSMINTKTWPNADFEYLVTNEIFVTFDQAITPLLDRLVFVADYIMKNRALTDQEIETGNKMCVDYVQFFRETFVRQEIEHIGNVNIRPKHHLLESHVPPFAKKWRSVGLFSESAIETYHADVNKLQVRWSSVKKVEQYLQLCDDESNTKFRQAAKDKALDSKPTASKK
jgi:hypothetical protein